MTDSTRLDDEIKATLQGLVHVPRVNRGGLTARPEFWKRCHLVTRNWLDEIHRYIFVDGFVGACRWNSWKVYTDAIEEEITLWSGFVLASGRWVEHAWCMLDGRIIETTNAHRIYYGAMLVETEISDFGEQHGKHSLRTRTNLQVATFVAGWREYIAYDPEEHWEGIGRERDIRTREIKEGLGR